MATMQFAIQTVGNTYKNILAAAQWAEAKGMAAFAIPDHYIYGGGKDEPGTPAYDAFSVVAGLARETSTIELVILVSPITFRHPAVLAKNAATIQEMAEGRFTLGVGTGWQEQEHTSFGIAFPDLRTRFEMMDESLGYLRAAFSDPPVDFLGSHYSLEAFDILPRPTLKLLVGGTGAVKTPQLAGQYADEFNAYPAPPDAYDAKVARARRAADDAGRDPNALMVSSSGVLVAADTKIEYWDKVEAIAAEAGLDPKGMEREEEERNAPRGTWDQVRAILRRMEESGLSRFYFQGRFDPEDIELNLSRLT